MKRLDFPFSCLYFPSLRHRGDGLSDISVRDLGIVLVYFLLPAFPPFWRMAFWARFDFILLMIDDENVSFSVQSVQCRAIHV